MGFGFRSNSGGLGRRLLASTSRFSAGLEAGEPIATLTKPFGEGTTFATVGTVPGQLALSDGSVVKGGSAASPGNEYELKVRASSSDGLREIAETFSFVAVTSPGEVDTTAPTITSANPSGSYEEGTSIGGTLTANEAVTWAVAGTDAAAVTLNATTGAWTLEEPVFATKSAYSFNFVATDPSDNPSAPQVVAITITEAVEVDPNLDESLTAPELILISAQGEYPPEFEIVIPVGINVEACSIRLVGGDEDFSALTINQEIDPIGTGDLDFTDLATITTGENSFRCRIEDGASYGLWSLVRKHGDTTAPVLSGDDNITEMEGVENPTGTVTSSETSTFILVGTDAGLVSITPGPGTSATWMINQTTDYYFGKRSYSFSVVATDLADLVSEPFPVVYNVSANPAATPEPQWSERTEDKNSRITLSDGNLTATVASVPAVGLVRNLVGRDVSDTSAFEGTVFYNGVNVYIGFCYLAAPLDTRPGQDNNHGIGLHSAVGGWEVFINGVKVAFAYDSGGANGDVLTAERVGTSVMFRRNGTALAGPYMLPAGTGDVFAYFAGNTNTSIIATDFTGY